MKDGWLRSNSPRNYMPNLNFEHIFIFVVIPKSMNFSRQETFSRMLNITRILYTRMLLVGKFKIL
jgi:hypothetical protein